MIELRDTGNRRTHRELLGLAVDGEDGGEG